MGGPPKPIAFFSFEEGFGPWEAFAQWVYGDNKRAPLSRSPTMADDAKAQAAIESHPGAVALISPLFLDGVKTHAIAVQGDEGAPVAPSVENVAENKYPITRPLLLVINDKPILEVKKFTDFMVGPRGRELMRKRGYLDTGTLKAATKP